MPNFNITLIEKVPFHNIFTSGDVPDLATAITSNLQGVIDSSNILLGQVGGAAPTSNVGLWVNGGILYYWNGSAYVPMVVAVGDGTHSVTLSASPTLNRTILLPDRDGTLALTVDIYTPRDTVIVPALNLDWSTSFSFYKAITVSSAFTMTNTKPGQRIRFVISPTGSGAYTFPAFVFWPSGTAPTATAGQVDLLQFDNDGGSIYGKRIGANYS